MELTISSHGTKLAEYARIARHAEQLGFAAFFVPDHLVVPTMRESNYLYRQSGTPTFNPDTPFADPWVLLGHLAAVTSRISLGVGVFVLPLRRPASVAKAIATAQELSSGRVLFGIGIGWMREEFEAVAEEFAGRAERAEEMLEVIRKLWTGQPVQHAGKFYNFREIQMAPGLPVPPPVLWGGSSPGALARAARVADGRYGPPSSLDANIAARATLLAELQKAGRRPEDFAIWARADQPGDPELLARYRDAGFTRLGLRPPVEQAVDERLRWMENVMRWARAA